MIYKEKIKKIQAGFTLIEIIIYIAIIGGVVAVFINFSLSVSQSRNKTYAVQEVQANLRSALDLITQKIQVATGVNLGASTFNSDPGVLSLSMLDGAKNPTIFDLSQNDGVLRITEGVGSPVEITSDEVNIINLVFTNLTSESLRENIRIEITADYNNDGSGKEFNYSKSLQTAASVRQ